LVESIWRAPAVATLVLGVVWLAWQGSGVIHARRIVADNVHAALVKDAKVDVVAEVDFEPERFHAAFFRDLAPVGGRTVGRQFFLANLDQAKVSAIGTRLWVSSVKLWAHNPTTGIATP
jgi:hypothetical protein